MLTVGSIDSGMACVLGRVSLRQTNDRRQVLHYTRACVLQPAGTAIAAFYSLGASPADMVGRSVGVSETEGL